MYLLVSNGQLSGFSIDFDVLFMLWHQMQHIYRYFSMFVCQCVSFKFFYFSVEYISWGNPPGTSPHFEDGTWGKLDSVEGQGFVNIGLKTNTTYTHLRT